MTLEPGTTLGRYQFLAPLGHGGMASWTATKLALRRGPLATTLFILVACSAVEAPAPSPAAETATASLVADPTAEATPATGRAATTASSSPVSVAATPTMPPTPKATEAQGNPSAVFNLGAGIAERDRATYRDGVALASAFLARLLGRDRAGVVTVTVIASGAGDRRPPWVSAESCCLAHDRFGIFLDQDASDFKNDPGWPTDVLRRQVVGHEYAHMWQYGAGCNSTALRKAPRWWLEGMAEYVGYKMLTEAGSIREGDALDLARSRTRHAPIRASLETLETAFPEGTAGFAVSYVALDHLLRLTSPRTLIAFCDLIAAGRSWHEAFEPAHGMTLAVFYRRFEEYRDALR